MIRNHKASVRRDVVGVALCALVGFFALTEAPVSVAELVSDQPATLNVRSIPLQRLVSMLVMAFGPEEITGLELLGDTAVTVRVNGVPARETLRQVLSCAGFAYEERGAALAIVPLAAGAGGSCAGLGMKFE